MAEFTCSNCCFWKPYQTPASKPVRPTDGNCRRHAPRLQFSRHTDDTSSVWPPTGAEDWCGDHRHANLPLPLSDDKLGI